MNDSPRTPLSRLRAILSTRGVPVGPIITSGGGLSLWLDSGPKRRIELRLDQRGPHAPYRTIGDYALSYRGAPDLTALEESWIDLFVALMRRSAGNLPRLLARSDAVGLEGWPLIEALPLEFPFCSVEEVELGEEGERQVEVLVRLTARCNQSCPFCSAPPPQDDPPMRDVVRLIARAGTSEHGLLLSLTGGEPTLRPDLGRIIAHALALPRAATVQIQTNAVPLASGKRLAGYPHDPRMQFFVSLHATEEALYDACTATRGQLPRAIEGIRRLTKAGHDLILNCVVTRYNVTHLVDLVESIPRLFPGAVPLLHFSVTMCPEHRATAPEMLVRYSEAAPRLEAALARAADLGVRHSSLQSSTHAAIPLCLVRPELRDPPWHRPRLREHETGYEDPGKAWLKAERCRKCAVDAWCLGLPRPYVARFGYDELKPITAAPGGERN